MTDHKALRRLRPGGRDEGQAIVFAAISMFLLLGAISLAMHSAGAVNRKISLQNAADASVMASAQVQANCLSAVAWLNEGMSYVYYHLLRYAADCAISATLAEFKRVQGTDGNVYPAPDSLIGISDPESVYQSDFTRADLWIPEGERWMRTLGAIERGIALIAPVMLEKEVYAVACANGSARTAIFPRCPFFPDPDSYIRIQVERIAGGWRFTSSTNMMVEATYLGNESWHIVQVDGAYSITVDIEKIGSDRFRIEYTDPNTHQVVFIDRTKFGDVITTGDGVTVTHNNDGTTTITQNGTTVTIRQGVSGMEVNYGNGWVTLPSQQSIDVGGATVRVDNFNFINVGRSQVWPDHINIGRTEIWFTDPLRIETHFGPVGITVREDEAILNGLSTNHADGLWHRVWDRDDRTRHRLTAEGGGVWTYEYQKIASYLVDEVDLERFAIEHAIKENDPTYLATGQLPEWTRWFDPIKGCSTDAGSYHQTRPCWHPLDIDRKGMIEQDGEWVVCPLCSGVDHDDDGLTDVRISQEDTFYRQGVSAGLEPEDRQSVNTGAYLKPLVLSEDFFKLGLSSATWAEHERFPLLSAFFPPPQWGAFAVACARTGFRDGGRGERVYNFESQGDREAWLASRDNLYVPDWEGKLFPVVDLIREEDLDADESVDSGAAFIFRNLAAGEIWRQSYFADLEFTGRRMYGMQSPWNGAGFNLSSQEIEDVLQH